MSMVKALTAEWKQYFKKFWRMKQKKKWIKSLNLLLYAINGIEMISWIGLKLRLDLLESIENDIIVCNINPTSVFTSNEYFLHTKIKCREILNCSKSHHSQQIFRLMTILYKGQSTKIKKIKADLPRSWCWISNEVAIKMTEMTNVHRFITKKVEQIFFSRKNIITTTIQKHNINNNLYNDIAWMHLMHLT